MAKVAKGMIDPDDAVLLLIDHQSGLFQLVKDMDMLTLRNNVIALAKTAKLTKTPTFTTASVPDGPNGPLIPEIHEANPEAIYIPRTGQINAWDNPKWVEAIENTGRKSLIIAGNASGQINLAQSPAATFLLIDTLVAVIGLALAVQMQRTCGTLDLRHLTAVHDPPSSPPD